MVKLTLNRNLFHCSLKNKLLVGVLLTTVTFIYLNVSSMDPPPVSVDVVYDGDLPPPKARSRSQNHPILEETVEFVPNRIRTLKTARGTIRVVDLVFTPESPLKKGQSVYSVQKTRAEKDSTNESDINPLLQKYHLEVPHMKNQSYIHRGSCKKIMCAEHLIKSDLPHFKYCTKKAKIKFKHEPKHSTCHFVNGDHRNSTALASYPRSGSTWVRDLLQAVTGLCTGGVYCDITLRQNGFPGEGVRSGVVLVVTTHQTDPRWSGLSYDVNMLSKGFKKLQDIPIFNSSIFLVRNPFDAILEEWERKIKNLDQQFNWNDFVLTEIARWQQIVFAWLIVDEKYPVLVVKYEDLLQNLAEQLTGILNFLHVGYKVSKLEELVEREQDSERFTDQRTNREQFTAEQTEHVKSVVKDTVSTLTEMNVDQKCDLVMYLEDVVPLY